MTDTKIRIPLAIVGGQLLFGHRGAEEGYNTEGDLVRRTADGYDLNALWGEFQQTLTIVNERRNNLMQILTFPVVDMIERVPQVGYFDFDEASEFGEPTGARVEIGVFSLGFDFKDYDKAVRYTWKFLRDAPASHIEAIHTAMIEADNRLQFRKVMEALFDNRNRKAEINGNNYPVYSLYNGDGTIPPPYKSTVFPGSHTHYTTSNAVLIDSGDVEAQYEKLREHGYGREQGTTFVLFGNRAETEEIRKFRRGVVNNNGVTANYDFIPASNQPAIVIPNAEGLLGALPPDSFQGLPVIGSYMGILIVEEDYIPAGYTLLIGSGGDGDLQNPVGIREHANPAYRGLRLLPGNQQGYPLQDSFYTRAFGTGIRQRGGASIMQYKVDATFVAYDIPAGYTRGSGLG